MKHFILLVIFAVAGYFVAVKFKPKPLPPAPPAPPPVRVEDIPIISPEEQSKIAHAANDSDALVRWEAIMLLDKMKAPQAYPVMFEKLSRDPDQDVRIKIINLLAERQDPEVTRRVAASIRDPEAEVRAAAIQALEKIGDYTTASAILEATKDPDESVRMQALRSLNALQDLRVARARGLPPPQQQQDGKQGGQDTNHMQEIQKLQKQE